MDRRTFLAALAALLAMPASALSRRRPRPPPQPPPQHAPTILSPDTVLIPDTILYP
jgi:hypothetical protein